MYVCWRRRIDFCQWPVSDCPVSYLCIKQNTKQEKNTQSNKWGERKKKNQFRENGFRKEDAPQAQSKAQVIHFYKLLHKQNLQFPPFTLE